MSFTDPPNEQSLIAVPPWEELTSLDLRASGPDPRASGPFFALPDDGPEHVPDEGAEPARPSRGILAGATAGFVAFAATLGAANFVSVFLRPQASPTITAGGVVIGHAPAWLKNLVVQEFGENDKNVLLLLGMYVTLTLLAMAVGVIAWRHVAVGVAALALFGAFGALMAVTRPSAQVTDMIPSIIGGVAGVVAITSLIRAGHSLTCQPSH